MHVSFHFTGTNGNGAVVDDELEVSAHEFVNEPQVLVRVALMNENVKKLKEAVNKHFSEKMEVESRKSCEIR